MYVLKLSEPVGDDQNDTFMVQRSKFRVVHTWFDSSSAANKHDQNHIHIRFDVRVINIRCPDSNRL